MRRRIELLDALRGLSVILMVAYHFGYDLVAFGFLPPGALYNPLLGVLEPFFAGVFIVLAGISSKLSSNNLKRGLIVAGSAVLVSAAGYIAGSPIWFGILHLLGACILLYALLKELALPLVLMCAFLCAYLGVVRWPELLSYDYFPLVPWAFLFFFGVWLGGPVSERRGPRLIYELSVPFLPAVGRHSLLIYLIHQPVLYSLTWLVSSLGA